MLNTVYIIKLENWMRQVEELFKAIDDMQQNDISELINRAREWEYMVNRVTNIKNFLKLNR